MFWIHLKYNAAQETQSTTTTEPWDGQPAPTDVPAGDAPAGDAPAGHAFQDDIEKELEKLMEEEEAKEKQQGLRTLRLRRRNRFHVL